MSAAALVFVATTSSPSRADDPKDVISQSVVQQGFASSPVPQDQLNLAGKNPYLVGLGSYLVNAVADCGGCHTFPRSLDPGQPGSNPAYGNPFKDSSPDQSLTGQVKANFNVRHFLAGGRCFGPVMSRNITPDPNFGNLPSGLTEANFIEVMRTGRDVYCEDKNPADPICSLPEPNTPQRRLQTMPWPAFHSMTDLELKAIYAYLSAIPHREACNTVADGCPGFSGLAQHNPPNNTGYAFQNTDGTCPNHPLPPQ